MDTMPIPLDAMHGGPGSLDDFRLDSPREVALMLRQLCDTNACLHLSARGGTSVTATLWSVDAARGSIGLAVDASDPALSALLEGADAVAVGYLQSVKIQFDAIDLVLVHGARSSTLQFSFPAEIYRFQRRGAFRVRPTLRSAMRARVRHSEIAEMQLALRVLDLSIGGCALFLPDDVPPMQPGQALHQVLLELDAETRISVDLRLQHVTSLSPEAGGVRLGCEFTGADNAALRNLQRFIDLTQKRGKLLSLG